MITVSTRILNKKIAILLLIIAISLFFSAGTIAWMSGWVFLVLFFVFISLVIRWLSQHSPDLLQERITGYKSFQYRWDEVIVSIIGVLLLIWLILMPLDAVRFQWSQMPTWLQMIGALVLLCSFYLFFLTFRENPYLSPVVRTQQERGQIVISSGPYHYVRHPMYSAFVLLVIGTPFLLGSWYGIIVGLMLVILISARALLEEHALQKTLHGYNAYMKQVNYRLIPYVW